LDTVLTIIVGLLVLTILVIVHELGHFWVGRTCEIKINEFGVGFGPKIWSKVKNGILYSVRVFPLGGFVQFYGEDEDVQHEPHAFNNRPVWQRFLTILAGPVANILFAFIITLFVLTLFGDYAPAVGQVLPGSTAEQAGLQAGDKIVSYDGHKIDFYMEFSMLNADKSGDSLQISVERDGKQLDYNIPYYYDSETKTNRIGINIASQRVTYGFFEAIALGFKWMYLIVVEMLKALGNIIFKWQGAQDLAGPVGTISIIGQAVRSGPEMIMRIGALLSINLGIINLLPLPALDGGRLVFLIIEGIRRKPFPREKEGYIHFAGIIILFGLMILLTYNDIVRMIS